MKNLLAKLSGFSGLFLLVLSMSNFYLAFRASRVVNLKSVTVTNVVEVVNLKSSTNEFPSASSSVDIPSSPLPASPPVPVPKEVAQWPYRYFLVNRRIGLEAFGRYYYEGSPCSYGRIFQIYPDRILLKSGDWISNKLERDIVSNRSEKNDKR